GAVDLGLGVRGDLHGARGDGQVGGGAGGEAVVGAGEVPGRTGDGVGAHVLAADAGAGRGARGGHRRVAVDEAGVGPGEGRVGVAVGLGLGLGVDVEDG